MFESGLVGKYHNCGLNSSVCSSRWRQAFSIWNKVPEAVVCSASSVGPLQAPRAHDTLKFMTPV